MGSIQNGFIILRIKQDGTRWILNNLYNWVKLKEDLRTTLTIRPRNSPAIFELSELEKLLLDRKVTDAVVHLIPCLVFTSIPDNLKLLKNLNQQMES
jgi:hypothetical protein